DDRDRASLPPGGVIFERAIEELNVSGLRAAWSADLGFAVVEPEVVELTESAALALAEAAGLQLVDRPMALTDPVRTWLSSGAADLWMEIEEGMYPEQADDMDPLSRRVFDATVDMAIPRYARIAERRAQVEEEGAAATPTPACCAWPESTSRSGPGPAWRRGRSPVRADQSSWSRRKRSTSAASESPEGISSSSSSACSSWAT